MLSSSKVSSTFYGTSRHRMLLDRLIVHGLLIFFVLLALGPICVVILNSFKTTPAIFGGPFDLPTAATFSVDGYIRVFTRGNFLLNYRNSLIVTVSTIVLTVVLSALAAYGLTEYRLKITPVIAALFVVGIMLPIRLGTVPLLKIMITWGLVDTLTALILVYTAQGLPLAVFILSEFMRQVSDDLKNAGRVDGLSEYTIFFRLVLPLVRPAMATVAVFTMIPIWNDLWFPLILAPGEKTKTVTLGAQMFIGQYVTNWNAVLSTLSLAILPVLILYFIFSRQLIRGITAGAVK
jgi:raffinose/stachyose/melibiose transport system permease protein